MSRNAPNKNVDSLIKKNRLNGYIGCKLKFIPKTAKRQEPVFRLEQTKVSRMIKGVGAAIHPHCPPWKMISNHLRNFSKQNKEKEKSWH